MSAAPPDTSRGPAGAGRTRALLAALLVLVLLLSIAGAFFLGARGQGQTPGSADPSAVALPRGATGPGGGLVVNTTDVQDGAPTVDVYLDFRCPWCKRFHDVLEPGMQRLIETGEARVVVHPKTILDSGSEDSSARAAAAAACAADAGRLWPYQGAVLARQPIEAGTGFAGAQLTEAATAAGLSGTTLEQWRSCVAQDRYAAYVAGVEEQSARDGVTGTPTYRIDGEDADLTGVLPENAPADPQPFFDQVAAARG